MDATYKISERDYVRATQLGLRLSPRMVALLVAPFVALAVLAFWGPPTLRAGLLGGLGGGIVVFVLQKFILNPLMAKSHYKKSKSLHGQININIKEDGVAFIMEDSRGIIRWSNILKWRQNKDYILLYLGPKQFFPILKSVEKSGFDLSSLISALRTEVGNEA